MNIYAKTENEKIVFLALENELDKNEIKNNWCFLGESKESDYASVMDGTWLGNPLFDENGIANYKMSDGKALERTKEEKQAEIATQPVPLPTLQEQVDALSEAMLAMMMGGNLNV